MGRSMAWGGGRRGFCCNAAQQCILWHPQPPPHLSSSSSRVVHHLHAVVLITFLAGYIKLELPVFHIGHFKSTVHILQVGIPLFCFLLLENKSVSFCFWKTNQHIFRAKPMHMSVGQHTCTHAHMHMHTL
jgi:hypothetical protein